jgi:Nif-specific regulatory protein
MSISTTAANMLMNYHWPGNVRELENCIERAAILSTDGVIHSYHLPPNLQRSETENVPLGSGGFKDMMTNMERGIIVEELKRSRGSMAKAARALGMTERMMGLRVARYGIEPSRFK